MNEAEQRQQAAEIAQEIADEVMAYYGRERLRGLMRSHTPANELGVNSHPEYFGVPMGATCGIIIVGSTCPLDKCAQSIPCEPVTDYNGGVTNE